MDKHNPCPNMPEIEIIRGEFFTIPVCKYSYSGQIDKYGDQDYTCCLPLGGNPPTWCPVMRDRLINALDRRFRW